MSELTFEYNTMKASELEEMYRNTATEVEWLEYPRSVTVRVPFMESQVFKVGILLPMTTEITQEL